MHPLLSRANLTVSTRQPVSGKAGLTLPEVVVSMVILGIMAIGIVASTLQIRRAAEASVRQSNANAVALGFLEQLQGMDYTVLAELSASNGYVTFIVRDGTQLTVKLNQAAFGDPLKIPINADKNGVYTANMDFWLLPEAKKSAGGLPSLDLKIRYQWPDPHTGALRQGELFLVKARTQD